MDMHYKSVTVILGSSRTFIPNEKCFAKKYLEKLIIEALNINLYIFTVFLKNEVTGVFLFSLTST